MKDAELFSKIVERLRMGPGLILLHHNADIDAVGSAIALQYAFPTYAIGAFKSVSQAGKQILGRFNDCTILDSPVLEKYQTIVILDSSSPSQLGVPSDLPEDVIVIDHHLRNELWQTELYYCDDSKRACAEIIFELLEFIDFQINHQVALALLLGILADTGHFKYATPQSLINFARIMEIGELTMQQVFEALDNSETLDRSQRIAHLKGAQRLKFEQYKKYLVAISQLSSYEASMCKHLLILGADVAVVGAQRDESFRISGRASAELVNKGFHLGELFQELGLELSTGGGGHPGAAGVNGIGDVEMVLNACRDKIYEFLDTI